MKGKAPTGEDGLTTGPAADIFAEHHRVVASSSSKANVGPIPLPLKFLRIVSLSGEHIARWPLVSPRISKGYVNGLLMALV